MLATLLLLAAMSGYQAAPHAPCSNPFGNPPVLATEVYTIVAFTDPLEAQSVVVSIHQTLPCVATSKDLSNAMADNAADAYMAYLKVLASHEVKR